MGRVQGSRHGEARNALSQAICSVSSEYEDVARYAFTGGVGGRASAVYFDLFQQESDDILLLVLLAPMQTTHFPLHHNFTTRNADGRCHIESFVTIRQRRAPQRSNTPLLIVFCDFIRSTFRYTQAIELGNIPDSLPSLSASSRWSIGSISLLPNSAGPTSCISDDAEHEDENVVRSIQLRLVTRYIKETRPSRVLVSLLRLHHAFQE